MNMEDMKSGTLQKTGEFPYNSGMFVVCFFFFFFHGPFLLDGNLFAVRS